MSTWTHITAKVIANSSITIPPTPMGSEGGLRHRTTKVGTQYMINFFGGLRDFNNKNDILIYFFKITRINASVRHVDLTINISRGIIGDVLRYVYQYDGGKWYHYVKSKNNVENA